MSNRLLIVFAFSSFVVVAAVVVPVAAMTFAFVVLSCAIALAFVSFAFVVPCPMSIGAGPRLLLLPDVIACSLLDDDAAL